MEKTIESSQSDKTSNLEKENIVVWLDFDAYAYINFGIISALSKLDKSNLIGIVATKQDMSFFQNQQIVEFKKLFYYPECYIKKSSFDINALKDYEKKYDLHLWLDVYSVRSFYKYWTEFHKFTKEEIFSIIQNTIFFFIGILEKFNPKLLLMQIPGENISNLLLYRIAKKMGIKVLFPNAVYMHNKMVITDNLVIKEISDKYKKLIPNFDDESSIYDEEFIKKQNFAENWKIQSSNRFGTSSFSQKINHYISRLSSESEPIYKNIGKTKLKMIKYKFQNHFEIKKRKEFLDANSIKTIEDNKFIYFPLQSEPEAKILVTASYYSNQVTLIENIAKSIPIEYILYVKEHPIQKEKLWRTIDDYKKIIALPNVKLVHPNVSSLELISKSHMVISIAGGTGFEALFYKKPVLLFTDEYYDELSVVTKIKTFTELPNYIRNALRDFKFSNKELNALMQVLNDETISVPYFSILKDGTALSSIQRYEHNFNLTVKHFEKFYSMYKNHFELIAQTIYSKL